MEKFEKIASLGRGAQGTVILVRRKSDGSKFVIKRIYLEDQPEEDRKDVMNEIKVLSMVAHPGIVGYFGSFIEDSTLNVVMEHADNGTLFQQIQRAKAAFVESELLAWAAQLLLALEYLHAKKILHRDLKTKNIFMTKKMKIKLGDFGLSRVMSSQTQFAQSAVGTPYYLSPELCEGRPYNHKSDVWALGCVLYELATFKHAFDATNLPALVMNIVSGNFKPVHDLYSPQLRELIAACLLKDPEARPSVGELLALPVLKAAVQKCNGEWAMDIKIQRSYTRPYFDSGSLETALTGLAPAAAASGSAGALTPVRSSSRAAAVLPELEEEYAFIDYVTKLRGVVPICDRIQGRVPYFKCFVGSDLTDYLMASLGLESRADAVAIAQRWMDAAVFYHVSRSELFYDGPGLYRFKEDEAGAVLNMKVTWPEASPARPAPEIEFDFRRRLGALIAAFSSVRTDRGECLVDYEGLALSEAFKEHVLETAELQQLELGALPFSDKIAFFINLYNALVLHGFVVVGPPNTQYQRLHFYGHTAYRVGEATFSLNELEHGILRGNQLPYMTFRRVFGRHDPRLNASAVIWDPRIHFALVRGTRTCPPLTLYDGPRLHDLLESQTRDYLGRVVELSAASELIPPPPATVAASNTVAARIVAAHAAAEAAEAMRELELGRSAGVGSSGGVIGVGGGVTGGSSSSGSLPSPKDLSTGGAAGGRAPRRTVLLPAVFEWYPEDFGASAGEVLKWVLPYLPESKRAPLAECIAADAFDIKYAPFNWAVNKMNRPPPPAPAASSLVPVRRPTLTGGGLTLPPPRESTGSAGLVGSMSPSGGGSGNYSGF